MTQKEVYRHLHAFIVAKDASWQDVCEVYNKFVVYHIPDPSLTQSIVEYLCNLKRPQPKVALNKIEQIQHCKVDPDPSLYKSILSGFAKSKDEREFLKIFRNLKKEDQNPRYLLWLYCHQGKRKEALGVFEIIENKEESDFTYLMFISRSAEDATKYFDEMRHLNIPITLKSYNTILRLARLTDDIKSGIKIFQRIRDEGLKPDSETYNNLMNTVMERGFPEDERAVCESLITDCLSKDETLDPNLFQLILNYCNLWSFITQGRQIFSRFESSGIPMTERLLSSYVSLLIKTGHTDEALELFDRYWPEFSQGESRDGITACENILRALMKSGQKDLCQQTFIECYLTKNFQYSTQVLGQSNKFDFHGVYPWTALVALQYGLEMRYVNWKNGDKKLSNIELIVGKGSKTKDVIIKGSMGQRLKDRAFTHLGFDLKYDPKNSGVLILSKVDLEKYFESLLAKSEADLQNDRINPSRQMEAR